LQNKREFAGNGLNYPDVFVAITLTEMGIQTQTANQIKIRYKTPYYKLLQQNIASNTRGGFFV